jgi:DNA-binding MarR family transcriptional regulator
LTITRTLWDDRGVAEQDLGRLLLEGHRAIAADLVALLDERGFPDMRAGHAALFVHVDRRSGTRLTELARRARMTKQGMMLVVDDLEERGYVRRVPDPEDARAKVVKLTARGRRAAAETRRTVQAMEARARRLLGDRRYEIVRESLNELVEAAREDSERGWG